MNRIACAIAVMISIGILAGCENMPWNKDRDKKSTGASASSAEKRADATRDAAVAVAQIRPAGAASTRPAWGKGAGTVTFTQAGRDKVRVQADLSGLPPGPRGFHIHEKGDLSAPDLTSAGSHFNPGGHKHGGPKDAKRHAGDMGNITVDASGNAKLDMTLDGLSVGTGKANDVVGKSVILHEREDDLKSDPTGEAGGRIAGGVIELKKKK